MIIKSKFKDYEVVITQTDSFIQNISSPLAFYVIDKIVYELYPSLFKHISPEALYLLDATEINKTIDTALDICEKITDIPAKRNTLLISCGGGIVQDVTGFVANIMYRGIKWIFIPTTLLAAADSCIGGKTSLNYKKFKNLLGTFYPPDIIYIYPKFFDTLTPYDYTSGLGEVVKFNVMTGLNGLVNMEQNLEKLLNKDKITIQNFLETSLQFKKYFIEIDEFDKGQRILLNFAHTFGHAFEVTSQYHIPHGSAVAIGMLVANHIAVLRNLLSKEIALRIESLVKGIVILELKKEWFNLDEIIIVIRKDKKQTSTALTAILLNSQFDLAVFNDIKPEEIALSVENIIQNVLNLK